MGTARAGIGGAARRAAMAGLAVAVALVSSALLNGELIARSRSAAAAGATVGASSPGDPGTFRIAYSDPDQAVREARQYRVIILNADAYSRIPAIKAANPNAVVLAYKDLSSTRTDSYSYNPTTRTDGARLPTGLGYAAADRNHPEWFLTGPDGRRLEWSPWRHHWQMDVGNPAYQQAWADSVKAELLRDGFDGVFMDNANWKNTSYNDPGSTRYAAPGAMQGAMRSMLARVGPELRASGLVTIANIAESRLVPGLWADWLQFVDGAMEEHFTNWSGTTGGPFVYDWGTDGWRSFVDQMATADRMDKIAVVRVGGVNGDTEAVNYGVATYLLANDGRSVIAPPEFGPQPSYPVFGWDLGAPSGPYRSLGGSAYRRDFGAGTVVVNASNTRTHTEALGGTFLDHAGRPVTSITLGPTRAAVLRSAGPAPAPGLPPAISGGALPAPIPAPPSGGPSGPVDPSGTPAILAGRYWVATRSGAVLGFPSGHTGAGGPSALPGAVGLATTPSGAGTWVVSADGRLAAAGDAPALGSLAGRPLNLPIVGMGATPTGRGYWMVAKDGGIFSFGDARFVGSTGSLRLNKPIVGMASTPSGAGYWLVASDGGIFAFGDARFLGSTGGRALNSPIVGMAASDSGRGYRLVAADGGVFTFGDAAFAGSAVGVGAPVVAVAG